MRAILHRALWNIGVFSLVLNIFTLAPSIFLIQIYDRVLPAHSLATLFYLSAVVFGALAFLGLMDVVRAIYAQRVAAMLDRELGASAFEAALSCSRAEAGDIQSLRDLASVRSFISSRGMASLFDLPFAPLFIVLLYFVHPILSLVTVIGIAIMILLVAFNQFSVRAKSKAAQDISGQANLSAQTFARSVDTLRSMGMLRSVTENWGALFSQATVSQSRANELNSIFSGLSRTTRMVLQSAILATGAYLILNEEMTAGMIFASSIISGRALQPIDQLIGNWKPSSEAWRAWQSLQPIIRNSEIVSLARIRLPDIRGQIVARNLTWTVPGRTGEYKDVLKSVNFEISPGESIAIIGPSGAGKTTLAKLLAGALEPTDGSVAVDGADYRTWDIEQIGKATGYLAQDVQLLPGTVAENIARFDSDHKDEDVITAAQKAQAHELIMSLPDGYQTLVGGGRLSGGMRQRVGLARAFFGKPKILILDEPNSNLDADGEMALEEALFQAKEDKITVVLITHRPTTALNRDKVMLLKSGVISDFGPSKEILKRLATPSSRKPAVSGASNGQMFLKEKRHPDNSEKEVG